MNNAPTKITSATLRALEGITLERWPHGGFVAYVNSELVREHRHHNPRVFMTPEAALIAAKRVKR